MSPGTGGSLCASSGRCRDRSSTRRAFRSGAMLSPDDRGVITGAAGLVGQNLIRKLIARGHTAVVGLDKHPRNTAKLRESVAKAQVIEADLAIPGDWERTFEGAKVLVLNHAQISGL